MNPVQFAENTLNTASREGYINGSAYRNDFPHMPHYVWWNCNCGSGGGGQVDEKVALIFLAIMASLSSLFCAIKSIQSAVDAVEYDKQKKEAEGQNNVIYKNAYTIWNAMTKERTASSVSQFLMALGLAAITAACIFAILNNQRVTLDFETPRFLTYNGVFLLTGGVVGYSTTQLVLMYHQKTLQLAADNIRNHVVVSRMPKPSAPELG